MHFNKEGHFFETILLSRQFLRFNCKWWALLIISLWSICILLLIPYNCEIYRAKCWLKFTQVEHWIALSVKWINQSSRLDHESVSYHCRSIRWFLQQLNLLMIQYKATVLNFNSIMYLQIYVCPFEFIEILITVWVSVNDYNQTHVQLESSPKTYRWHLMNSFLGISKISQKSLEISRRRKGVLLFVNHSSFMIGHNIVHYGIYSIGKTIKERKSCNRAFF